MQQPPDPGTPGHAAEQVQVTGANVGSFSASDSLSVGGAYDARVDDGGWHATDSSHVGGNMNGAGHAGGSDPSGSHLDGGTSGANHAAGAGQTGGDMPGANHADSTGGHGAAGGNAGGGGGVLASAIAGAEDVGYRGPTACHAAGISYRQLDYWARTGLVVPSVRDAAGSGSQRLYSFRDIVVLKVVKRLLDAGVSLQNIRKAIDTLRSRGVGDLAGITLISDGTTVYECRSPEEVVDLLQGGQGVFGIAISGAFKEIEGTLSHLPAEAAATGEELPAPQAQGQFVAGADDAFNTGDELAMRRARRRAG